MEDRRVPPSLRSRATQEELEAVLRAELPAYLAKNRMGGFVWDFDTDRIFLDPGALAVFEFEPGEFDGRVPTLHARMVPGDLPVLRDNPAETVAGAAEYGGYFRVVRRNGRTRWTHVQGAIQYDGRGRAVQAVGIIRDADAELSHVAEQTLLASDRKHQRDIVQAVTASLSRVMTVQDLLDFLTGQPFLDVVGATGVALSVLEQDRRRLLATTGLPADLLRDLGVARVDAPLPIAQAIRYQTPLFVTREDVRDDYPLLWPYIEPTDLTATAILPLAAQAQPTGALAILYEGKRKFPPEERNLLFALGATFAQSLQRALLYDQEHSLAVGLQQAMLPARIAQVPGLRLSVRYQPARTGHQVGGDWYDAMPLPDGRVGLVVGDVQGHDVRAAAIMGQLRTALRAYATEGHPPSTVVARASSFLNDLDTDLIATCVCVFLDPSTGVGQIVRAGHPYPIVRGADRRSHRVEALGGLPLGLPQYAEEPHPTTEIRLAAGDVLLLCTDGLLESHGSDFDTGVRQIQNIMDDGPDDLDDLAEHIVATVEKLQGQEDDIALLLASRNDALPTASPDDPPDR